jgi:hypothetical protein
MIRINQLTILVASLSLAACGGLDETTPNDDFANDPGATVGSEENTFDHDNSGPNPFDLIQRLATEGPPSFSSKLHSCAKIRVTTLGNVLAGLGVNINNNTALSAGRLFRDGATALGGPDFANRIRENIGITTSGSSKLFDIMAAAAPEVIANIGTIARCNIDNQPAVLFDASNNCVASGVTCLLGSPATQAHLDFCSFTVRSADGGDLEVGKRLAVAAILAAANMCE